MLKTSSLCWREIRQQDNAAGVLGSDQCVVKPPIRSYNGTIYPIGQRQVHTVVNGMIHLDSESQSIDNQNSVIGPLYWLFRC